MAKEKKNKKEKNDKKPFVKDFKSELKKVVWPTPKQLFNSTSTVIMIVLLTALMVFVLDFCFDKGYQFIIDKSESIVKKNENNNTNSSDENTIEAEEVTSDTESSDDTTVVSDESEAIVVDDNTETEEVVENEEATTDETPVE